MTVATIERTESNGVAIPGELHLEPHQRAMLEAIGCADAPEHQLRMFFDYAQRTGLNPFERQIYLIGRNGKENYRDDNGRWCERWVKKWTIQTGIDGFRSVAESSDQYAGQTPVEWCDRNGHWLEAWPHDYPPVAARVGVERHGHKRPTYATAHFREYCPNKNGKPSGLWGTMPAGQLAKCAEALALRKAFPKRLSGMYVAEEMEQADGEKVYNISPQAEEHRNAAPARPEPAGQAQPSLEQYRAKVAESLAKVRGDVDKLQALHSWASDPSRYDEKSVQEIEVAIHEARASSISEGSGEAQQPDGAAAEVVDAEVVQDSESASAEVEEFAGHPVRDWEGWIEDAEKDGDLETLEIHVQTLEAQPGGKNHRLTKIARVARKKVRDAQK